MCGIVYRKSFYNNNIAHDILNMYKNQRSRGTEGFGFYVPDQKRIVYNTQEQGIVKTLKKTNATEMLFHHRMPTSTDNVLNACHPFRVEIEQDIYVIVHNGYLYNEDELKIEHYNLGYEYRSIQPNGKFNDSEALAYDIALYLSGKQTELKAEGAIAFIAIKNGKTIYFGRNASSPLVYNLNDKHLTIRSEGNGITCKTDTLYKYENNKITSEQLEIPDYTYYGNYGGYNAGYNTPGLKSGNDWWDREIDELEKEPELSDDADGLLLALGLTESIKQMQNLIKQTEKTIEFAWYNGNEQEALLQEYIYNHHTKVLDELLNYREVMK